MLRYLVPALLAVLLLAACEETIDPLLETDRQFTLWGTLDMNADTQYVRVVPIRPTLDAPAGPLDAAVTSTDLNTGETVAWRDSVITFSGGTVAHVFYAPLRVQPQHTYRIEVTAPDRPLVTSATTTIPPRPEPVVAPEDVRSVTTPQGARITAEQQVRWNAVPRRPFRVEQWYRFLALDDFSFRDVVLPFEPPFNTVSGDAWVVDLNLLAQRAALDSLIDLNNKVLAGLAMRITVLDDAFVPPGGLFDPEVLVQPGTLTNVENGFGFVGSVGRFSVEWVIADSSARILDYTPIGSVGKLPPAVLERLETGIAYEDR